MSNTENEDFDVSEMESEINDSLDFEEFEDENKKSISSSIKNNAFVKFGLIAAAVLAVIFIVSLFGGETEAPPSLVSKGAAGLKEAPGTKEVTPAMKQALEEQNDRRVEEAQMTGTSAIPTPIEPPKAVLETTVETTQSEDPLLRWQQMQMERAQAQRQQEIIQGQQAQPDPQRESRLNTLIQAMSGQIQSIMSEQSQKENWQHMTVFDVAAMMSQQASVQQNAEYPQNNQLSGAMNTAKAPMVIIPAGQIDYAQMLLEANSDIQGPVIALMTSGKFAGSKLMGSFTTTEDYLVIRFNSLVTKKGTTIPINAYAINPNTSLTALATDVDHRYWKRIILPAAASFIQGLGEAYSETASTTTQGVAGTTTTTSNLNTKQEWGKAVSKMSETVSDIINDDSKTTKPLIIVRAGTPMGVLFMQSITDNQIQGARSGSGLYNGQQQENMGSAMPVSSQVQSPSVLQQIQNGLQQQQLYQQSFGDVEKSDNINR